MTPFERENPTYLNGSRRKRVAAGSGTTIADVNRLLKQFESTRSVMKKMTTTNPMAARLMKKKKRR
jgi:signal recognition particle subunit SRP54